jgi:hypothetical protein
MRTTDTMIEAQIKGYMKFNLTLEQAADKVDRTHLSKHTASVKRVVKKLSA